ncbi:hypothetical protein GCM10010978_25950 [Compostibacillus humi]|uniref:Tripartite ATP-independent periplasmic transporters DctQ component domain-containing protein n=1 Tax=Compostibacillus humi TaxID=1245525 RepID=A0A8J2TQ17_9BACI|nr:TRAP transporter small permease subunit [Compostibacillus humi]GFZ84430.1 hypothetical protein GCM10010978_25950 [Compostibacillus humi]
MNKTKIIIDKILLALSSLLLLTMVVLSLWQILSRYVFNMCSEQKKHIAIVFFREKFNPTTQRILQRLSDVLVILVAGALMVYGGFKMVMLTSSQTAAATGISMGLVYLSLPISGIFVIFYTIHSMATNKKNKNEEVGF